MTYIVTPPEPPDGPRWHRLFASIKEAIHTLSAATGLIVAVIGGWLIADEVADRREARITRAWKLIYDTRDAGQVNVGQIQALESLHQLGADLTRLGLQGQYLRGLRLPNADLTSSQLSEANLVLADLSEAILLWADLSGATLWEADLSRADLGAVDLRKADLTAAILSWAEIGQGKLSEAILNSAELGEASLQAADLKRADLMSADLTKADLGGADLSWADLRWADLTEADLRGANLSGVIMVGNDPPRFDPSEAKSIQSDLRPRGLTQGQLNSACADPKVPPLLPPEFDLPPPCD